MSIMSYNGGAVMAMKGKNCVAIAADRHFGIQAQMVTTDFQEIFPMGGWLYIGLAGLATDIQTVAQCLKFRLNLYELKEGQQIKPYTFTSMVANPLYEKHFGPYYTDPSPEPDPANTLISDFPASRTGRNQFLVLLKKSKSHS
uniref:Uncharacterized protein n=1 Tax=Gorilla gorilla gorilla TaxID=9595 RepID=A0A2I2YCU2_GORGO